MTITTDVAHGAQTFQRREFTALDRCDQCGARAWMRALLGETELLFCAHHASAHFDALVNVADYIQDDRELMNADSSTN